MDGTVVTLKEVVAVAMGEVAVVARDEWLDATGELVTAKRAGEFAVVTTGMVAEMVVT